LLKNKEGEFRMEKWFIARALCLFVFAVFAVAIAFFVVGPFFVFFFETKEFVYHYFTPTQDSFT
jgi:hypothetical protein